MKKLTENLKAIYTAAIKAVDPEQAVKNHLLCEGGSLVVKKDSQLMKTYNLDAYKRIIIVGSGKATAPMAKAVESLLGSRIHSGTISVKYGYTAGLKKIRTIEAAHPVPDENSVKAAQTITGILEEAGEDDLVISLISGGGSALLTLPPEPVSLEEKQKTTGLLLKSGASIHEINAVRKHLSRVKGGNMARAAWPATVLNCMISDVVGDNMDVIASGPFVPDNSRFSDALAILNKYKLAGSVPDNVLSHLKVGQKGRFQENPEPGSIYFEKVTNCIIASNLIACSAAAEEARKAGYNTLILSTLIEGDTADAAFWHARIAREIEQSGNPVLAPACIISGGETTVKVTGNGVGGRNMEFAMQAARHIEGARQILIASVGTDGTDGPTDAAGAYVTGATLRDAQAQGLDYERYVSDNDSYALFNELGTVIKTGPTNTNVMDVRIILVKKGQ